MNFVVLLLFEISFISLFLPSYSFHFHHCVPQTSPIVISYKIALQNGNSYIMLLFAALSTVPLNCLTTLLNLTELINLWSVVNSAT